VGQLGGDLVGVDGEDRELRMLPPEGSDPPTPGRDATGSIWRFRGAPQQLDLLQGVSEVGRSWQQRLVLR
jgi:hypothetical protein